MKMNCPACKSTDLLPFRIGADTVDKCHQCHGLWFNGENLGDAENLPESELLNDFQDQLDAIEPVKAAAPEKDALCPLCRKAMNRYQYDLSSGIWVHACPDNQGVWLDKGEVIKIHRHLVEAARDWPQAKLEELYKQSASAEADREKKAGETTFAGLDGVQRLVYHLMEKIGVF